MRDNAEWYVYEEGYEYVYTEQNTHPFAVARNGEMRYIFNREDGDTEVLRYTEDLIHHNIKNDEELELALEDGRLEAIDTPWFEVWDLDTDTESDVYHSLAQAEQIAIQSIRQLNSLSESDN